MSAHGTVERLPAVAPIHGVTIGVAAGSRRFAGLRRHGGLLVRGTAG
jgi:hypothetical protein